MNGPANSEPDFFMQKRHGNDIAEQADISGTR